MEKQLQKLVSESTLKWLPWIGNAYQNSNIKFLIVGESHYSGISPESKLKHQNENFTRIVINELALRYLTNDKRSGTLYRNLNLSLIGEKSSNLESRTNLWNKVCFYNFIQEEMQSINQRPSKKQLFSGWESFDELVRILKPTHVLFIGSKVCEEFSEVMNKSSIEFESIKIKEKLTSRQIHRFASIKMNDKKIELHFIKHTSQYFSWQKWNEYLKKTIPLEIQFLEEKV
jgi:hypothetical protein